MKPTEETQKFWLMLYAMDAFKKCIRCCESLLEQGVTPSNFAYLTTIIAILTMYGKPFHFNRGGVGKLDERFVPLAHKNLHELMIRDRDKIHAHVDAKDIETEIGNANQIRLVRSEKEKGFAWTVPTSVSFGESEIQEIILLCKALIEKLDYHTTKYEKKVVKEIRLLTDGEYVLNFDLNDSSLFTRVQERGLSRDITKWTRLD